jgi:hypothetical protein
LLSNPKWREFFESLATFRKDIHGMKLETFDKQYIPGNAYSALIVYKDGFAYEGRVIFNGMADLCDQKRPLVILNKRGDPSPQPKRQFAYFVFDQYLFRYSNFVSESEWAHWGIVYLNGPIHAMKTFIVQPGVTSPIITESHFTFKHKRLVTSNIMSLGTGGGAKKSLSKMVNDYPEMAEKIMLEEEGYRLENRIKILEEYNAWVSENQPEIYQQSLYLK